MIQDIAPHQYHNAFSHNPATPDSPVFCFQGKELLLRLNADGEISLPRVQDLQLQKDDLLFAFSLDTADYYLLIDGNIPATGEYAYQPQTLLRQAHPQHIAFACATAFSLCRWYRNNRYCGSCGRQTRLSGVERALVCPDCGNTIYPKICPAVITAITDGDRLLLTRYTGRPFKRYALVAGFNEIGESIEDTVHREVMEETGLKVKNMRFYKSQPWVFTDSLLMGFFVDLDGSDQVTLQEDELCEGTWFHRDEIPESAADISLTSEMIALFRQGRNP